MAEQALDNLVEFIQPGKPEQNCFVESFECLSENWFVSLDDARRIVAVGKRNITTYGSMVRSTG